jgi:hypothetical protein
MDEKVTSLEENATSLNESRPPTSYGTACRMVICVELLIIAAIYTSFGILINQHPPGDWWCEYPHVVFFLEHALLFGLWRVLLDWKINSPTYATAAAGCTFLRFVVDYLFLFSLIVYPKRGAQRCIQGPRS